MDLRVYYQKIRKLEAEIADPFVVVVSRETQDGGKAGVMTDVPRSLAARMIVEDRADMASAEETAQFYAERTRALEELTPEAPVTSQRALKPVKKP